MYDLKCKITQQQPNPNRLKRKRVYQCQWQVGDVFAYELESDLAKEKGLTGRYFLIQKVDEAVWHPGHIVPIVYVKITKDDKLPTCAEEYNQLEFVQTFFTRYEDRYLPLDARRLQEDIQEKSQIVYETDEYGYLPQYRIKLLNTSKRVIPSKLVYWGNVCDARTPEKEFIPHSKLNVMAVPWKRFGRTFETILIECYCNHNCRELSIYEMDRQRVNEKSAMEIILQAHEENSW